MKQIIFFLLLSYSNPLFAQYKSDSIAIVDLLKADYKTLERFDIQKHVANCTQDYRLIEDGEIWNLQKEIEYFKANANRSITRKDNFSIQKLTVSGNIAYAIYILRSQISEKNQISTKAWTESAVFHKTTGKWKIAMIHSTTIQGKQ